VTAPPTSSSTARGTAAQASTSPASAGEPSVAAAYVRETKKITSPSSETPYANAQPSTAVSRHSGRSGRRTGFSALAAAVGAAAAGSASGGVDMVAPGLSESFMGRGHRGGTPYGGPTGQVAGWVTARRGRRGRR